MTTSYRRRPDPNFSGTGRCRTDTERNRVFGGGETIFCAI
jgi:hypothetical protein